MSKPIFQSRTMREFGLIWIVSGALLILAFSTSWIPPEVKAAALGFFGSATWAIKRRMDTTGPVRRTLS